LIKNINNREGAAIWLFNV